MLWTPTGPSDPASAPNHSRISAGSAGRNSGSPATAAELGLAQLVVAPQHHQNGLPIGHQHQALHLRRFGQPGEPRHVGDRLAARRVERLGAEIAFGIGNGGLGGHRRRFLEVGRIAADLADRHQVFAGVGRHHELVRLAAAHGAGMRLDHQVLESAAVEDAAVGVVVPVVGNVEAGLVHVEAVGILHQELPHAQHAGFGSRLIAKLGLNLIPDLGKLLVAAQFAAGDGGHDFFVRHAQAQVAPEAVFQAEHVVAHDVPAARFLPDLGRVERRQHQLLCADGVHLLAHDALDLQQGSLRQEEVAVDARRKLPDVPSAQQQLVADHLRFSRGFPQRGNEQLAPEHRVGRKPPILAC